MKTMTAAHATDGSPDSRQKVGVREEVAIGASVAASWTVSDGTYVAFSVDRIIWTAPPLAANCTITATPTDPKTASPCTVSFEVVPPSGRALARERDLAYTSNLAGSGFVAGVTILPTDVSFSRIEVREEEALGVATGYYDSVLGWNGKKHGATSWTVPGGQNIRMVDTVGTELPGSPGPFSKGTFDWEIPQTYRSIGSTQSIPPYAKANHSQEMFGVSGAEGTFKEGAGRGRRPHP
ncbi:MAG TPA: hypothetical protein PLZ79_03810 [Burkholderiales bacterium]|nr:hypothetical protein [Burkholderiales bacterium]